MKEPFAARIQALRDALPSLGADAVYLEDPVNIRYLTGFFAPESAVLLGPADAVFVTDFRMLEDAAAHLPGFTLAEVDQGAGTVAEGARRADALAFGRVAFEAHLLPYRTASRLVDLLGARRALPLAGMVETLRARKDAGEVAAVERALRVAEQAFAALRGEVRPGLTEKEIADRLESLVRAKGGSKGAFDSCVLAAENAALPHGVPSPDRVFAPGEPLLLDFGAQAGGYHSDVTRMLYAGAPAPRMAEIHTVVAEAQQAAFAAVRPGVAARDVDRAAREVVERAGYGPQFRHGLGHGVGLQVHEAPRVSWLGESVLEPGMIFTVEPGIYLPGFGGVRLEDMVLVTETGMRNLTTLPAGLEEALLEAVVG